MGTSSQHSVVDTQGRSHEHPNLYIADASVSPLTGGGESLSLTIEALAVRTADAIFTGAVKACRSPVHWAIGEALSPDALSRRNLRSYARPNALQSNEEAHGYWLPRHAKPRLFIDAAYRTFGFRGALANRRSYSQLGRRRRTLATTPICQGITV